MNAQLRRSNTGERNSSPHLTFFAQRPSKKDSPWPTRRSVKFCRSRATIQIMNDKFTVGLIQMRSTKDAEENLSRAATKIREAARHGAQIVCMHELFRGEYFCRTEDAALFDLAEAVPGPATEAFGKVARENKVALVVSLFERRAAGVYHNTCAVQKEKRPGRLCSPWRLCQRL